MNKFLDLFKTYRGNVDFAIVYIEEAHPSNTWNMKVKIDYFYELLFTLSLKGPESEYK